MTAYPSVPRARYFFPYADILARFNRPGDAEAEFADELQLFPQNVRARAGLAALYHASGQGAAADTAITDMLHAVPTPEAYTTAARLLKSFGKIRQAEAVRAEARRTFATRNNDQRRTR